MTIRPATVDDIPRLVEMGVAFLAESIYGKWFQPVPTLVEAVVRQTLEHGAGFVAVSGVNGAPLVGMIGILLGPHSFTGALIASEIAWYVEPRWRGSTIGPRLLVAAREWATTNGATMLQLVAPTKSRLGQYLEHIGYEAAETAYVLMLGADDARPDSPS
jgi:GNAT superfamily N-acetyltransferase